MGSFGLNVSASADLLHQAANGGQTGIDFSHFTNMLGHALDENELRKIIDMSWEVAKVDSKLHEFEDSLIWRVANLLGVLQSSAPPPMGSNERIGT